MMWIFKNMEMSNSNMFYIMLFNTAAYDGVNCWQLPAFKLDVELFTEKVIYTFNLNSW